LESKSSSRGEDYEETPIEADEYTENSQEIEEIP